MRTLRWGQRFYSQTVEISLHEIAYCSGQNLTPARITTRVQTQEHEKLTEYPHSESSTTLKSDGSPPPTAPKPYDASLTSESEVIQPLGADSTPDWIPRHVATLSITTDRSRCTSSREICYAILSTSSSIATLQLNKQLKTTIDHPYYTPILIIWIRSRRLQGSADSIRAIEDLHLSTFTLPSLSSTNMPSSPKRKRSIP